MNANMIEDDRKKILLENYKYIAQIDQEILNTHGWYIRVRFLDKAFSRINP
jgi:hypothetical protein